MSGRNSTYRTRTEIPRQRYPQAFSIRSNCLVEMGGSSVGRRTRKLLSLIGTDFASE
jgi:hypothetical protein